MENTTQNKSMFIAMHMIDGQNFVLTEESYYDTSSPQDSMGHGIKSEGFVFPFDWCVTQNAFRYGNGVFPYKFISRSAAELKPLSSITDEDFTEIMWKQFPFQPTFKKGKIYHEHLNVNQADLLRSKGYALPYMGLSVNQLIEYGWIKLKEVQNG